MSADEFKNLEDFYDSLTDTVEIPHQSIVNPNLFFVRVKNETINYQLVELEAKIKDFCLDKSVRFDPAVGEICVYYEHSLCLRVHVDVKKKYNDKMIYILWALDHGYPLCTDKPQRFCKLPAKYQHASLYVIQCSLNILPAKKTINFTTQRSELTRTSNWTKAAVDLLTKLVIDAAEIRVAPNNKTPEGIQVLDVLIKSHSGQISSMEQVLMNYDAAAPVKREVDLFNYLKAQTIERWNDNECSGGIIKVIKKLDSYQEDIPRPEDPEKNFDTSASMKKVQQWKDDFSKPKTLITESTRKPLIGKASSDISSIKSILNRPFEPLSSKKVVPKTAPKAPVPATNSHLPPDSIRYIEMIKAIHKGMYKFKVAPAVEPEFQNNPAPKQESREALQDLKDSNHSFDDLRSESSWNKLPPSQAPDTTLKFIKASRSQEAKPKTKSMFEVQERLKQQAFKPLKEEPPKSRPLIFIPAGANYDDSFLRSNPMKPSKKLIPTSISSSHKSNKSFQDSIPEMKVPVQLKTINSTNSYEKAARNEACPVKKSDFHRVLVYGQNSFKYVENIEDVNFSPSIYKEMKKMRWEIYRAHQYSWQNILEGSSMMIVASKSNGKTFAFLPAICSILYEYSDNEQEGIGPVAIIVVKSSADVEMMFKMCSKFTPDTKIVEAFGNHKVESSKYALLNGCHLLITTPGCFARITSSKTTIVDRNRLKHLIIDDLDSMVRRSETDIHHLLKVCCSSKPENNPQIVVTSNLWMPIIEKIRLLVPTSLVCIANYIEAAVFARCSFLLKKVNTVDEKIQSMILHMKDTYSTEKTLIIASSDAIQICNKLKPTSIRYLLVDGEDNDANKSLMHKWINEKPGKMTVLVCTDEIFKDLRFKNVQHLIHFTLPESWTSFGFRFSSCFDFYMKNVENNEQKSSCLVLLDNENNQTNRELPRLIEFLKSHKLAKISPEIEQMVLSIVKQQELDNLKDFVPFCDKIINFGHCENSLECASRHVFTDWDLPGEQIPKDGRIKFEIIKVRTAKQISVKILAKRPVGSNIWVSVCDTAHISLFLQMTNHFNNQDNHQIYAPIILNGLCAISTDTDIHQNSVKYHRCRVLQKVGPKTPAGTPSDSIVVIRLIDDGSVMRVKSNELINLPEQFKVPPAQVVDIYMQDVVPVDFEQSWDKTIASKLTEIIQQCQQDYPQCSFTCRVNWALADIVMTNTIEITQQLKEIGADVCLHSLKKILVDKNYVMLDPEVLPNLRELGKNCGIFLESKMDAIEPSRSAESDHGSLNNESLNNESPNIESSQRTVHVPKAEATELTVDIPKENWVYVSPSTIHQVVICEFISPDSFFVQIVNKSDKWFKFIQKLDDHEPKKIPLENGKPGVICLAITEDGLVRVKLLEELNGKFKICNLDNGYLTENVSKEFLYEIPLELLTYIPFQGIHCKLTGIRPHNSKSWSLEASEEILNRIIAINPIYMKTACQQKTSKDLHELVTCASYKVILLDHSAEPPIKLNQTLIQESLADEDPSTSTHLDVNIEFEECWDDELDSYESSEESGKFSLKDENENEPGLKFEDFDIMFEDKEFFETIGLPSTAKFVLPDKNPLSVTKPKENLVAAYKAVQPKKACVKEPLDSDDDSDDDTSPPVLVTATKHPRIEWQQTESLIRLKIQAIDCLDYSFEVNYETISILIKYTDSYETCTLHLFGGIDPTMTSHEIQGLNVVIRLKKLVASPHLWPRLQVEAERSIFVKNDYSVIMAEKEVKEEESYFNVYDDENSDTDSMEAPDLAEEQDDLVVAGEHDEDLKSDDIVMID